MSRIDRGARRRDVLKGIGAASAASLAGLAGCTGDGGGGGREIKLGVLMGVTGGLSELGPPIRQSGELVSTIINDADTDFSVDLQFEDTQTDPNAGISGAESLSSAGYPMINGALSSTVSIQVARNVSIPNEMVQCSPASTSPAITDLDDNDFVYRTTPHDALQSQVMAQVATENLGGSSTSYLALNNDYGQGLAQAYASAIQERDGEVVAEVSFEPGQSSYTSQLNQALSPDPDVLMIVGYPESGVQIFRDYYSDYSLDDYDILVPDGLKSTDLPGNVGHDMSNVWGTAPLSVGPGLDYFETQYADEYGSVSQVPFTAQSFDSSAVLCLANAAAGENSGPAVRDQMRNIANPDGTEVTPDQLGDALSMAANGENINYQGASGPIQFDDNGDIAAATYELFRYSADGLSRVEEITYSGN